MERCRHLLAIGRTGEAVRLLEEECVRGGGLHLYNLLGYALYQDNRIAEAERVLASRGEDAVEAGQLLLPPAAAMDTTGQTE